MINNPDTEIIGDGGFRETQLMPCQFGFYLRQQNACRGNQCILMTCKQLLEQDALLRA